jgi:hypothetical protein
LLGDAADRDADVLLLAANDVLGDVTTCGSPRPNPLVPRVKARGSGKTGCGSSPKAKPGEPAVRRRCESDGQPVCGYGVIGALGHGFDERGRRPSGSTAVPESPTVCPASALSGRDESCPRHAHRRHEEADRGATTMALLRPLTARPTR